MNSNIKKMAGIAIMMALVIVLQLVGGLIPPVGGFSISLVLIPIVLGAAVYGPWAGMLLGATFGVVVTINCITGADVGGAMVFQANPVLCILVVMLKGMLAGFGAGWVYLGMKQVNSYVAMLLSAIVCPLINTGFFILCMMTFFKDVLAQWAGGGEIVAYVLSGLVLANFVPELIINVVFSPAGNRILQAVQK